MGASVQLDAPEASARSARLVRVLAVALVVAALAPIIAVVITRIGRAYIPTSDIGLIDMRVRDVWSLHPPLVGPYSRYGWSHPGPLMFWLLAIPSGLTGQASWATLVGGALLQGIAIVWIAILAWRRAGLALLAAAMAGVSMIYASTGSWVVLEPWNPHIAMPFFALFVFQAWLFATGDHRILLGAVVSGSFLVQTHVGYAPLVAVVTAVAVFYVVADFRRNAADLADMKARVRRAAIVLVVLWSPAIVESFEHPPGNLARVVHYFLRTKGTEPPIGLRAGAQLLAAEFRWPPAFLGGSDFFDPLRHPSLGGVTVLRLLVPMALLASALYVSGRRHATAVQRLLVMVTALFVSSVVVLGRVTGVPYPYLFYWRPIIAVLLVLGVAAALVPARALPRPFVAAAAVVTVALVVTGSGRLGYDVLTHGTGISPYEGATKSIASQLEQHGAPARGAILRIDVSSLVALQRGIFDAMDRADLRVYADSTLGFEFGDFRTKHPDQVDAVWWVGESGSIMARLSSAPGARVIAYSTPLDATHETEARRLQSELLGQLAAAHRLDLAGDLDTVLIGFGPVSSVAGVDHDAVGRLGLLNADVAKSGTCRCGVVEFPARTAPTSIPG